MKATPGSAGMIRTQRPAQFAFGSSDGASALSGPGELAGKRLANERRGESEMIHTLGTQDWGSDLCQKDVDEKFRLYGYYYLNRMYLGNHLARCYSASKE